MATYEETFASAFLRKRPGIRKTVLDSQGYLEWRGKFPAIEIDGVKFYLIGGPAAVGVAPPNNPGADQPKEEDEMILSWARMNGLVLDSEFSND